MKQLIIEAAATSAIGRRHTWHQWIAGQTEDQAKPVGAVMVVGGGIGGMQASLDLAESGFYVYLVDTSPTIGGVMAQLDKTFPTNDCAMCIMSPKLVGIRETPEHQDHHQCRGEGNRGRAGPIRGDDPSQEAAIHSRR